MGVRLFLLLAVVCLSKGQDLYYDIGPDIELNGVTILNQPPNNRKICFDGTDVYYTDGPEIFVIGNAVSVVDLTGITANIDSISCHCNILVFSYRDGGVTFVVYYDTDGSGISILINLGTVNRVAVELSPTSGLVIVGITDIWIYHLAPLSATSWHYTYNVVALDNLPCCVAAYATGTGDLYVFVTLVTNDDVQLIFIPGGTSHSSSGTVVDVFTRVVRLGLFAADVFCVDINQGVGQIYYLVGNNDGWSLDMYPVSGWLQQNQPFSGATQVESGTPSIPAGANGLVVCGTDCQSSCSQPGCSCPTTGPTCGFCIGGDSTCQCEDSGQNGCVYEDPTLNSQCFAPSAHFDSYCIVDYPLAQRRRGGPIRVVGVAGAAATITVSRLAQTGRWDVSTLPIRTGYSGNTAVFYWDGFEAAVPSSGRGRRFGVYEAYIDPNDPNENPEYIPCIATENSGFYNQFYTYTRSLGGSVTLVATMRSNLLMFESSLRWYFTGFDPNYQPLPPTPIPSCFGSMTCTLSNLDGTNQGVYEVYRPNRQKRTWHPLFYLFVRGCIDSEYGPTCGLTCPQCLHGVCDDFTGLCTCQAGWTGTLCDTPCPDGEIGQSCGIPCSDIFPGRTNCWGLSFCVPGKVGCHCYSGFEAPVCETPCTQSDTCGPSCDSLCNGGIASCNPRTCDP